MAVEQALQLLGLSRRAGQLVTGENLVLQAIRNRTVSLVILASDAGPTSAKKIRDKTRFYEIPLLEPFDKATISQASGLQRTVLGVKDPGLAQKIISLTKNKGA